MKSLYDLAFEWLDILARGDFQAWRGRVHENVRFCFPFAPPGMAGELIGFEEARAALAGWNQGGTFSWKDIALRETEEPGLLVATLSGVAELPDGDVYRNNYVIFMRFAKDMLIEHVEYFNPVPIIAVMNRNTQV